MKTKVSGKGMATEQLLQKAAENPGRWSKDIVSAWTQQVRDIKLAASMLAATKARCGCGNHGDWSSSVSGTSAMKNVVWAGCSNCRGTAIGYPVLASDYRRWLGMSSTEKAAFVAHAVCLGTYHDHVLIDIDTIDSTIDIS